MMIAEITSGGLYFVMDVDAGQHPRLIHFANRPFDRRKYEEGKYEGLYRPLVELHMLGFDINYHHGSKHIHTSPAAELCYESHTLEDTGYGKHLRVCMKDENVEVIMNYLFYDNASVVRSYAEVKNISKRSLTMDYLSSFALEGIASDVENWDTENLLYVPNNTWHGELQWTKNSLREHGLENIDVMSLRRLSFGMTGTWSTCGMIPMGILENTREQNSVFWQIENNGSWYYEIGELDKGHGLYLQLCGPQYEHNHFLKTLEPGESFVSVPAACGICDGSFDEAVRELTKYRRNIRRKNEDNEELPVIFNDYMNCLWADPTTEKEIPLIDAAAEAGAEYFVMDAGWFAQMEGGDADWWSSIGVWKEADFRFPNGGLRAVMDYIREKGMKPGLWIEIEGIGPDSELANTLPDDWFFQIHGERTIEHYRYQLDFRNPQVRKFADDTLEDVVTKYDIKYLKIDYNINAGLGTDLNAESVGSGLLEHCRAYLAWMDAFLERHPDVVIENCASGGQRMDYAMLSRLSIQSTSDQTHYELYPSISAMAGSAVTPEQAAVWSYPNMEAEEEEAVFNMVNAMLGRVHQSGFLNKLPKANFARVKEGIACYKAIRQDIKTAFPRCPLGIIPFDAPWAAAALDCGTHWYLSVWRKDGENATQEIPITVPEGAKVTVDCIYPQGLPVEYEYVEEKQVLRVTLEEKRRARLFQITWK